MAKVVADTRFVGTWKCSVRIKEVIFNNSKLAFPELTTKIITIQNTPAGTAMYLGQPGPDAKPFPATRTAGIAVEFFFKGQNDKYLLNETIKINIVDTANLIGESVQEWSIPGKGIVAKVITQSDYHRIGRMR